MKLRTDRGLALGLSRNLQGGIHCYSLHTNKVLDHFLHDVMIIKMPTAACCQFAY